jgi:hypothetical protein
VAPPIELKWTIELRMRAALAALVAGVLACAWACAGVPVRDGAIEAPPAARIRKRVRERPPVAPPLADRLAWARRLQAEPDAGVRAATCVRELGIDKPWTDCEARGCGRSAVVLEATLDCGADSCDGDAYVVTASGRVAALPYGGHKACAPDGSFVVADVQLTPTDEDAFGDPRKWQVVLHRFPTDGAAPTLFADCMSPSLAPDGEGFLCRDRSGALLAVGLEGGETRMIKESGVAPEQVEYDPRSYVYPTPPRFVDGVVRFAVETTEGPIELGEPWPPPQRPIDPCGATLCDDEGNCVAADPKHCRP